MFKFLFIPERSQPGTFTLTPSQRIFVVICEAGLEQLLFYASEQSIQKLHTTVLTKLVKVCAFGLSFAELVGVQRMEDRQDACPRE